MQRLTNSEKNSIGSLIAQNTSLKQISRLLNKNKTTIYYHFRKSKGRTMCPIRIDDSDDELVGEFMGLFAGDGCAGITDNYVYKTQLFFNNNTEKIYVSNLIKDVLVKLFRRAPTIYVHNSNLNLGYYSKSIHSFIDRYLVWDSRDRKTYSVHLKERNHSEKFIIGFLRGSIDSDGSVSQGRARFASVSKLLIDDISFYLTKLNIKHGIYTYHEKRLNRKDISHIEISRLSYARFMAVIKPRNIGVMKIIKK